jgi:hypothetical protein
MVFSKKDRKLLHTIPRRWGTRPLQREIAVWCHGKVKGSRRFPAELEGGEFLELTEREEKGSFGLSKRSFEEVLHYYEQDPVL